MHEEIYLRPLDAINQSPQNPLDLHSLALYVPFQLRDPSTSQQEQRNASALEMRRLNPPDNPGNPGSFHQDTDTSIRRLYNASKDAFRQFNKSEPPEQKELTKDKISYGEHWRDLTGIHGYFMSPKLAKSVMNQVSVEQATPVLLSRLPRKYRLPRELIDRIQSEIKPMTAMDRRQLSWAEIRTGTPNLSQHGKLIEWEAHIGQETGKLDEHSQRVVELQTAINNRQDAIDRLLKEYGTQIARRLGENLRYPRPKPWEKRIELTYQLLENTPLTKKLITQDEQQRRAFLSDYVRENESSVYKQTTEEQSQINASNAETLGEIRPKVNQNNAYNAWRNSINKAYLEQLKKAYLEQLKKAIGITKQEHTLPLPSFEEHISFEKQFNDDASWNAPQEEKLHFATASAVCARIRRLLKRTPEEQITLSVSSRDF